jgi:hypothetical protein
MAIEKKTGLFYELMIRGNWDPQKGALGAVMTYQLQTGAAIVDTDTNTLAAPYAPDPAVDLTKEQAVAFLGDRFAGFLEQIAAERKRADDATAQAEALTHALAAAQAKLDAVVAASAEHAAAVSTIVTPAPADAPKDGATGAAS